MGRNNKLNQEQIIEVNKLYNKGATMKELGKLYGVSPTTINKYIWEPRHRGEQYK
jgi:transposase